VRGGGRWCCHRTVAQVRIFRAGEFRAADRAFTAHSQPLTPSSDYSVNGGYCADPARFVAHQCGDHPGE
jgi:hypothetical protein